MADVNDRQVGGEHYRAKIQHWDFAELNGLGYLESAATKYLARNRKKHTSPIIDLEKAQHYTEKLQALYLDGKRVNRAHSPFRISVSDFIKANHLTNSEKFVIAILVTWRDEHDLDDAINAIKELIRREEERVPKTFGEVTEDEHF